MSDLQYIVTEYSENSRLKYETLFHVASGRLGIRGCFEEGAPEGTPSVRGTYLNGFCETLPISYNEKLCGFPEEKQQIVNLPDAQTIRLRTEGEEIVCWKGTDFVRCLDMGRGVYERSFVYHSVKGALRVRFTRLVSFAAPELFAIECRIESLGFEGKISIQSELNADVHNFTDASDPRVASGSGQMLSTLSRRCEGDTMIAEVETIRSHRRMACAVTHDREGCLLPLGDGKPLAFLSEITLKRGETAVFHKYAAYRELCGKEDVSAVIRYLQKETADGFEHLLEKQREYLSDFWSHARVITEDDAELQTQLDFSLYGMLSSAGKDGLTNVAAKGLSGEGYEGHYFWDSEIYVFPFFLLTAPGIARSLLEYRYLHLNDARRHARRMGHPVGALYPWRTITGSECSSHYPTGSAQYHINGDIARAFTTYFDVTGDRSFLPEICEVLAETARLWLDAGHWLEGTFRIDCVTGPDEYTCLVNNNYYTNACAAANLLSAARLWRALAADGKADELQAKLSLSETELAEFARAGENMYFPYDESGSLIAQDDSFLRKKRWPLSDIPAEDFPLLLHFHPLLLNRCQILKQADSVLANAFYREETPLVMMRSYEYYEQITTHDSSLSHGIYSIMAARLGDTERAWRYFEKSAGTDMNDHNGNTRDGLHVANMGGIYAMMTAGFGGLRCGEDALSIFPLLPDKLRSYSFPVRYRGSCLRVSVQKGGCTLQLTEGAPVEVSVYGKRLTVGREALTVRRRADAVLFDLDGVVTDTAPLHFKAWKRLADELGIDFDETKNEQFKGVSRDVCLRLLLDWGGRTAEGAEFANLLTLKNEYYLAYLKELKASDVLPGIRECLAHLRKRSIPYALFSVSKNTDAILSAIGLDADFPVRVTGLDISHSKPHYEGYLLAAERLGVDPRLCVMVEDSEAGLCGARSLSMLTLAVMRENVASADVCVPATTDIETTLFTLLDTE